MLTQVKMLAHCDMFILSSSTSAVKGLISPTASEYDEC